MNLRLLRWIGVLLALLTIRLSAQEKSSVPVLDWLFVDTAPIALAQDLPTHPKEAKWWNNGFAAVSFVVNEQGDVEDLRVLEAYDPAYASAAITAVTKWKFHPGIKDDHPVKTRLQASFMFAPDSKPRLLVSLASYGPYTGAIATGKDVKPVALRFQAEPYYPPALRQQGISGRVVLKFVVTETGEVAGVRLVSAVHPLLAVSAANALLRWRFIPATKHGHPVAVELAVPFDFNLTEGKK